MSWLWKKKAVVAEEEPQERVCTVIREGPLEDGATCFFDPFDLAQRKRDLAVCDMFEAERVQLLAAKARGGPLVSEEPDALSPITPKEEGEATPAEEWLDEPTEEGVENASIVSSGTPLEALLSDDDKALTAEIDKERALTAELAAAVQVAVPEAGQDRFRVQLDLLRFLRARKYNVAAAATMWREAEAWAEASGVRRFLAVPDPKVHIFQSITPHRNHGFDYQGHPVYYERTGLVSVAALLKHMTDEEVVNRHLRYVMYSLDRMALSASLHRKNVTKVVMIHDLAHLKFNVETAGVKIFKKTVSLDQNYFPERLHKAFIINAPLTFRTAWALVKPLLDAKTSQKIEILGKHHRDRLLEFIPPSQLPAHYGGTCRCTFANGDSCLPPLRADTDADIPEEWPEIRKHN